MRWLDSIMDSNGREFEQTPGDNEEQGAWHAAVHGVAKSQIQLSHWTTITANSLFIGNSNVTASPVFYHQIYPGAFQRNHRKGSAGLFSSSDLGNSFTNETAPPGGLGLEAPPLAASRRYPAGGARTPRRVESTPQRNSSACRESLPSTPTWTPGSMYARCKISHVEPHYECPGSPGPLLWKNTTNHILLLPWY